jgi:hypothetical protein
VANAGLTRWRDLDIAWRVFLATANLTTRIELATGGALDARDRRSFSRGTGRAEERRHEDHPCSPRSCVDRLHQRPSGTRRKRAAGILEGRLSERERGHLRRLLRRALPGPLLLRRRVHGLGRLLPRLSAGLRRASPPGFRRQLDRDADRLDLTHVNGGS